MSTFWTDKEKKIVHKLLAEDRLYKDIAAALRAKGYDRSAEAVRKYRKRNAFDNNNNREYDVLDPSISDNLEDKFHTTIDDIRSLRDKLIKVTSDRFIKVGRPVNATKKILSLSDMHIPFENPDVIEHALKNHSDANILVLNGDIFEMYLVSKWPKSKSILLRWEYEIALEWMKLFSTVFSSIVLVSGNHEHRLQSYFSANIDPAISFLVNKDILSRLASGYGFDEEGVFTKVYDFGNIHYDGGPLRWYHKIGKAIFAHPLYFSSVPMRTVINTANHFLDKEDFEAVIMGHSHKIGKYVWRNKLVIEQGCCCVPLEYESTGRIGPTPQSYGYAIIYMDKKGHVDFDKTDTVYYGSGSPVKLDDALRYL